MKTWEVKEEGRGESPSGGSDVSEDQQGGLCGRNQVSEPGEEWKRGQGGNRAKMRRAALAVALPGAGSQTGAGKAEPAGRRLRCSLAPSGGEVGNSPPRRRQKLGGGVCERVQVGGARGGARVVAGAVKQKGCISKVEPGRYADRLDVGVRET